MKIINRTLPALILACTTVLYVHVAGAAPKGGGEPLSATDPTSVMPASDQVPEFLHWMPLDPKTSTESSGLKKLYGREHTPVEGMGEYRVYEWGSSSNDWKTTLPVTGVPFFLEPDPAPRIFANAAGNERYFWLKPPVVQNRNKAGKKKPDQLFSLKSPSTREGSMEERIRTGVYHYDIIRKTGWRDWMKSKAISDTWDGFLIYRTETAPVTLISFDF